MRDSKGLIVGENGEGLISGYFIYNAGLSPTTYVRTLREKIIS